MDSPSMVYCRESRCFLTVRASFTVSVASFMISSIGVVVLLVAGQLGGVVPPGSAVGGVVLLSALDEERPELGMRMGAEREYTEQMECV